MREDLIEELLEAAPILFPFGATNGYLLNFNPIIGGREDYGPAVQPCAIRIEDGWHSIALDMCRGLNRVLQNYQPSKHFYLSLIKEKWGIIRILFKGPKPEEGTELDSIVRSTSEKAGRLSRETCEFTGRPGIPAAKDKLFKVVCKEKLEEEGWRYMHDDEKDLYWNRRSILWWKKGPPVREVIRMAQQDGRLYAREGEYRKPEDALGMYAWLRHMRPDSTFLVKFGGKTFELPPDGEARELKDDEIPPSLK